MWRCAVWWWSELDVSVEPAGRCGGSARRCGELYVSMSCRMGSELDVSVMPDWCGAWWWSWLDPSSWCLIVERVGWRLKMERVGCVGAWCCNELDVLVWCLMVERIWCVGVMPCGQASWICRGCLMLERIMDVRISPPCIIFRFVF